MRKMKENEKEHKIYEKKNIRSFNARLWSWNLLFFKRKEINVLLLYEK